MSPKMNVLMKRAPVLLLSLLSGAPLAQVEEEWVARYPGNLFDYANVIAVDAVGNVLVTGKSPMGRISYEYTTLKYDSEGNQLWVARYSGPVHGVNIASGMALDGAGNVYVTGGSRNIHLDYATVKYDPDGNQLWVARYSEAFYTDDTATAIALDPAGNVYVTGLSAYAFDGPGSVVPDGMGGSWYLTLKYDSDGNQLWVRDWSGGDINVPSAVAVDAAGNAWVTGSSSNISGHSGYATVKYDLNGNQLWFARYRGPGSGDNSANAIALDASGNVYVTGGSDGGGSSDYATVKYDSAGNQLWEARFRGPGSGGNAASAIALDGAGNVYVTGVSDGGGSYDYATVKYDSEGNQLWVARYEDPENRSAGAASVVLDAVGNVYVTGTSGADYATVKYDSEGNQLWVARYHWPVYGRRASAMALDEAANVYVTGGSCSQFIEPYCISTDIATIKYSRR